LAKSMIPVLLKTLNKANFFNASYEVWVN
jgi:hypothetical protein